MTTTKSGKGGHRRYAVCDLFDEYQFDNCKIELVEMFPCLSKRELEEREGYFIRNNDCVNKFIAGRTRKERYEDNKELKLEYQKQYYQSHKDRILKHKRERYRALIISKQNEHP